MAMRPDDPSLKVSPYRAPALMAAVGVLLCGLILVVPLDGVLTPHRTPDVIEHRSGLMLPKDAEVLLVANSPTAFIGSYYTELDSKAALGWVERQLIDVGAHPKVRWEDRRIETPAAAVSRPWVRYQWGDELVGVFVADRGSKRLVELEFWSE